MISLSIVIFIGAIFLFDKSSDEIVETGNHTELKEFEQKLEQNLMIEIGKELFYANYSFGLEWDALSMEDVKITVNFPEKFNGEFEDQVRETITDVVKASIYNPEIFTIDIRNYELMIVK